MVMSHGTEESTCVNEPMSDTNSLRDLVTSIYGLEENLMEFMDILKVQVDTMVRLGVLYYYTD